MLWLALSLQKFYRVRNQRYNLVRLLAHGCLLLGGLNDRQLAGRVHLVADLAGDFDHFLLVARVEVKLLHDRRFARRAELRELPEGPRSFALAIQRHSAGWLIRQGQDILQTLIFTGVLDLVHLLLLLNLLKLS